MSSAAAPIHRPMRVASTDYDILAKSIIIGDSSVGKSSLLYRYTDHDWNPHYIATIGVDFKVMTFERSSKIVKLQLWDTAGQERFRTITHTYYRGAHGVMLVFDVTSHDSFVNLNTWLADIKRFGSMNVPMLLVGNKCDCKAHERQVDDDEAAAFAAELGCDYVTTSARNDIGVEEAFSAMLEKCVAHRLEIAAKLDADKDKKKPVPFGIPVNTKKKTDGPCTC
jgi:Ras-related protein Rab-1A